MQSQFKLRLWLLTGIFILSTFMILSLYLLSTRSIHRLNGFKREIAYSKVTRRNIYDLKYNSYYIAGATPHHIYLGNYTAPAHILVTDYNFSNTRQTLLNVEDSLKSLLAGALLTIDSPNIYISNNSKGSILYSHLSTGRTILVQSNMKYFGIAPISSTSSIVKALHEQYQQTDLFKQQGNRLHDKPYSPLLEAQMDGHFSVDGMLHYDRSASRLLYLYYYRNQFICLDTNLNILYKGKTIDTFTYANIRIGHIESERKNTLLGSPNVVNRLSCIGDNKIFVNSKVEADNEGREQSKNNSVIDVYSLKDGSYLFSFYLPKYKGMKVSSFRVFNNTLFAFYENFLITYSLTT